MNKLKEVLYGDKFREYLKQVTGIDTVGMNPTVDMSAAVYQDTHRLLPHDDRLAGRRIAYIL